VASKQIMMHTHFCAALLLLAAGCAGGDKPDSATPGQATVASTGVDRAVAAAAVANAIAANPAGADSILRAARYTEDSFGRLLYEIAADSAQAAAYTAARHR
jgi:hypothetical protein